MAISKITSDAIDATGFNLDSNTLTIDATNNRVGIGTASPSTTLDCVRNGVQPLRVESTSGTEVAINMVNTGGNVQLEAHSGNFNIDAGAVGIGTTTPLKELHLHTQVGSTGDVEMLMDTGSGSSAGQDSIINSYRSNAALILKTNNAERVRLLSGGGLTFNGDTATANALDDYEEGTWTPEVKRNDGTVAASIGVGAGASTYVKIGRLVTIKAWINSIANGSADGSSYWRVNGLPYAAVPYTPAAKGYGSIAADGYYVGDAAGNIILTSNSAPYTGSLSGTLMIGITYETDS